MAKITDEMKELMKNNLAFIATATSDGIPSVAPKGTTTVIDEEHIAFAESAGKRTYDNIKQNPKAAVIVCEAATLKCLRFSGTAEVVTSGPLFERFQETMKKLGASALQAVVNVRVEEIYDCGTPGFGKRID